MWLFSRDPVRDFPFELGPPDPDPDPGPADPAPLWRQLRGRRKADGAPVSVFVHSLGSGDPEPTALARAALKRLRSLRHPNVLGFMDSMETEQSLYLVTEEVTPLRWHLRLHPPEGDMGEQEVAWGLHQLLTALAFLGGSGLVHHALGVDAVFVDPGGDWKLGGLERVAPAAEGGSPRAPGVTPRPHDPPELSDPSRGRGEPWAGDMWRLGCLIWEIFNGPLPRAAALRDPGKVPGGLVPPLCELVAADPSLRPGPEQLLQRLQRPGAFLSCTLVRTALFLTEMQLRDPAERRGFLQTLPELLGSLPGPFLRHKLLPRLLQALELGSADATALRPLLKVAKLLDPPEFQERVVPVLVRLFASPDRALRMQLLQQLEDYVEFLPTPTVDAQIFPHVARGFLDTNPAIREQTVKSMVLLAPRLGEGLRGGQLLRLLLRVQTSDALGPLRCNATLCLGRLAHILPPQSHRVLLSSLARATRDPFPPARAAAASGIAAARRCFCPRELAGGALPPLCPLTCDPHPGVREQAFRVIRSILDELEAAAEKGGAPPSTAAAPGGSPGSAGVPGGPGGGLGAAVSWAVTGVTALTARIMGHEGGAPSQPPPGTPEGPPRGPPEETPEETPDLQQAPPSAEHPLQDPDGWDDDWGSLEDMELPLSPSPHLAQQDGGAAPPPPPPRDPSPPAAPPPPPGGGAEEGDGGWGVGGEWGSEDAWEEPAGNRGPPPGSGQRQQQRRRELEHKRRGGPRGPPKTGPQKLGTRKLD